MVILSQHAEEAYAFQLFQHGTAGMAEGKTNAGIAEALVLSGSAVEKHVNAIFSKLGLAEEPQLHRVAAVLAFLRDAPA